MALNCEIRTNAQLSIMVLYVHIFAQKLIKLHFLNRFHCDSVSIVCCSWVTYGEMEIVLRIIFTFAVQCIKPLNAFFTEF